MRSRNLGQAAIVLALVASCLTLTAAAQPNQVPTPLERQWALAAGPAVKIEVKGDGWYWVRRSLLRRVGASFAVPSRLRLYANGQEVPILIDRTGIRFYGQGLDTPSTGTRTYWLVKGAAGGLRIPVAMTRTNGRSGFARSFSFTLERKYRTKYVSLQNGNRGNFFGPTINPTPTTLVLAATALAQSSGSVALALAGLSQQSHKVKVVLNGTELGKIAFRGRATVSKRFRLPRGALRDGANSLTLTSIGGELDYSLVDTARLTYPRRYQASHGALRFSLGPGSRARLTGFARPTVSVIDVTRPRRPRLLRPAVRRSGSSFTAFIAPASRARKLFAVTTSAAPAAVMRNRPSDWNEHHGADLVIIGYRAFLPELARLKAYHEQEGLKVALVDVGDLYDEFSFGSHGPEAIKAFLARARLEWRPAPRYVILAGDATSDPRNYLHLPARDFVPTKTVDTQYLETASDDWFADFDGDGVPEMAVGRLPVRTTAETATVVDKIIRYEQGATPTVREALLVSDTGFEPPSVSLAKLLPAGTTNVTINRRDGPTDAAVRGRIVNELNRGPSIVNFYGHGAVDIWTGAPLLNGADAAKLQNTDRLSLFVMMTCLNGYFLDPRTQSLAEALLRAPDGGAFAVWASSALTVPGDQIRANEELFRQLAAPQPPRLGDAMVRAKQVIQDPDVRRSWILFGDPVTHLR